MSDKIFSGNYSRDMWEEINNIPSNASPDEIRLVIYFVCCRIQELEDKFDRALKNAHDKEVKQDGFQEDDNVE